MASTANVPEIINSFNVYNNGNILIGVSGAVTLPSFDAITETISGAGILGEYETGVVGQYGSMQQEVPFRVLSKDVFSIMDPTALVDLTFRGNIQSTAKSTGAIEYEKVRVVERGRLKAFNPGSLEMGKQMSASVTLEVLYILVEIENEKVLEYDKLNSVFVVGGKDLLEKVRANS